MLLTKWTYGTKYPKRARGIARVQMTKRLLRQLSRYTTWKRISFNCCCWQRTFSSSLLKAEAFWTAGGGAGGRRGVKVKEQMMRMEVREASSCRQGSRPWCSRMYWLTKLSPMVKMELPAVTIPLTIPILFLK